MESGLKRYPLDVVNVMGKYWLPEDEHYIIILGY